MEPGAFSIAYLPAAVTGPPVLWIRIRRAPSPPTFRSERPIKLELLINLKSAKILGPKIPEKLLALASEAIE